MILYQRGEVNWAVRKPNLISSVYIGSNALRAQQYIFKYIYCNTDQDILFRTCTGVNDLAKAFEKNGCKRICAALKKFAMLGPIDTSVDKMAHRFIADRLPPPTILLPNTEPKQCIKPSNSVRAVMQAAAPVFLVMIGFQESLM